MYFVYLSPPSLRNAGGFFSQGQTCNNVVVFVLPCNNWFCIKREGAVVVMTPAPLSSHKLLTINYQLKLYVPSVRQHEPADISSPELAAKI